MPSDQSLFSELTPEELRLIADYGVTRTFAKNVVLIHEDDASDSLYVILSGRVRIFVSDENGKEGILNTQGPGECFGELALIDAAPRSASVMTLEPSKLAIVSKGDFERCLAKYPSIAIGLIRVLSRRVRALTDSVKSLALLDVYGRVAHTLLKLARERDGVLVIEERLTHQDLADMVGASREMVSRIMKELVTGGYIESKDKTLRIRGHLPAGW